MNVLIAYPNNLEDDNLFVSTLANELLNIGVNIKVGLDEFWNSKEKYDIIHFQWPNSLFQDWTPTDVEIIFLEKRLIEIKNNSKILYTRHNSKPHYNQNKNVLKSYDLIEKYADAIVHLGSDDLENLKHNFNDKLHFIIPHHIYEFNATITKEEARRKLKLPQKSFVVLTFGSYRNKVESDMVLTGFKNSTIKNKILLATRVQKFYIKKADRFSLKWIKNQIIMFKFKLWNIYTKEEFVSNENVQDYFIASDVVLIQRLEVLNSGNLFMAFNFKKAVIGPNTGNVGQLLKETGNILFNPLENRSLSSNIELAHNLDLNFIGKSNYEYAMNNLKINIIANKYKDVYERIQ